MQEAYKVVEEVLVAAAEVVDAVLVAADKVEKETASVATAALSSLVAGVEQQQQRAVAIDVAAPQLQQTEAQSAVLAATSTLTSLAIASLTPEAPELTLTSPKLNLSLASRDEALLTRPITCNTTEGRAAAALPADLLTAVGAADPRASVEMAMVVFSSNMHSGTGRNSTPVGPMIGLTVRQNGAVLTLEGLPSPVNITLPIRRSENTSELMTGVPTEDDAEDGLTELLRAPPPLPSPLPPLLFHALSLVLDPAPFPSLLPSRPPHTPCIAYAPQAPTTGPPRERWPSCAQRSTPPAARSRSCAVPGPTGVTSGLTPTAAPRTRTRTGSCALAIASRRGVTSSSSAFPPRGQTSPRRSSRHGPCAPSRGNRRTRSTRPRARPRHPQHPSPRSPIRTPTLSLSAPPPLSR